MSADTLVRLADYKPPVWSVDAVELRFELFSTQTLVHAQLSIQRLADAAPERLCWPAVAMEIQALAINGCALAAEAWCHQDGELVKALKTLEVQEMGGRPVAKIMRMGKVDSPDEWTQLTANAIEFDLELPDNLFTLSNLRNPRQ